MATIVESKTTQPNEYGQTVTVRKHTLAADYSGTDTAPGPHDYFDVALATCKTITATWYAKRNGIPLERVESHVERDDSDERKGVYRLKVRVTFFGPLTDQQRATLYRAISACPIHKLMTATDVQIETVP